MLAEYVHCLTPAMCTSRVETLLPASSDNVLPTLRMRRLSASPDHWVHHIAISTALTTQAPTHNLFASRNAANAPRSVQQPYCTSTLPSPPHPRSLPHTRNPQVCMYVCAITHIRTCSTYSSYTQRTLQPSLPCILPCISIHPSLSIHVSIYSLQQPRPPLHVHMYVHMYTHTYVPVSLPALAPACRTDYRLRLSTSYRFGLAPAPLSTPRLRAER